MNPEFKKTRQRQMILDELIRVRNHPTADELYERVRKRLPRISLGTIYRNLEALSECGAIQKLEIGGAQKRFDANVENHYHIRCIGCGKVEDAPVEYAQGIIGILDNSMGFEILGHRLEFFGRCPQCRE